MRWTPEGMALPAERSTLQIEPMKLVVGRGDFVSKIVNLLGLKDRYCRQALVSLCDAGHQAAAKSVAASKTKIAETDLAVEILMC